MTQLEKGNSQDQWNLTKYTLHPDFHNKLNQLTELETIKTLEALKKGEPCKFRDFTEVVSEALVSLKSDHPNWQSDIAKQLLEELGYCANPA